MIKKIIIVVLLLLILFIILNISYISKSNDNFSAINKSNFALVGSYKDNSKRTMKFGPGSKSGHDAEKCKQKCSNYKYIGLQYYGQCFCTNNLSEAVKLGKYKSNCGPNEGNSCCAPKGKAWCNYIYDTSPSSSAPSNFNLVGSFKDTLDRALKYGPHKYGYTAETCKLACPNYKYIALQNGNGKTGRCSCSNSITDVKKYGAMPPCGPTGGPMCNYVYDTTPLGGSSSSGSSSSGSSSGGSSSSGSSSSGSSSGGSSSGGSSSGGSSSGGSSSSGSSSSGSSSGGSSSSGSSSSGSSSGGSSYSGSSSNNNNNNNNNATQVNHKKKYNDLGCKDVSFENNNYDKCKNACNSLNSNHGLCPIHSSVHVYM